MPNFRYVPQNSNFLFNKTPSQHFVGIRKKYFQFANWWFSNNGNNKLVNNSNIISITIWLNCSIYMLLNSENPVLKSPEVLHTRSQMPFTAIYLCAIVLFTMRVC